MTGMETLLRNAEELRREVETLRTADVPAVMPVFNLNSMFNLRTTNTAAQNDTALAAAKAALPASGGILYIGSGSYDVSAKFTIDSNNVWLMGDGRRSTILFWTGAADVYMVEIDSVFHCGIARIELDCDHTAKGIHLAASTAGNQSNIIRDVRIRDPRTGVGIADGDATDPQVDDWTLDNVRIQAEVEPLSQMAHGVYINSANSTGQIYAGKINGIADNGAGITIADNLALTVDSTLIGADQATGAAVIRIVGPSRTISLHRVYEELTTYFLEVTSAAPGTLDPVCMVGCRINHPIIAAKAIRISTVGCEFAATNGSITPMIDFNVNGCHWSDNGSQFESSNALADYISVSAGCRLELNGTGTRTAKTLTLANGDNDNVQVDDLIGHISITGPTAAFALTGVTGGWDGREMILSAATVAQAFTIKNSDIGSTDINRILTGTGADIALGNNGIAHLIYQSSRWRVISARGASGAV